MCHLQVEALKTSVEFSKCLFSVLYTGGRMCQEKSMTSWVPERTQEQEPLPNHTVPITGKRDKQITKSLRFFVTVLPPNLS